MSSKGADVHIRIREPHGRNAVFTHDLDLAPKPSDSKETKALKIRLYARLLQIINDARPLEEN